MVNHEILSSDYAVDSISTIIGVQVTLSGSKGETITDITDEVVRAIVTVLSMHQQKILGASDSEFYNRAYGIRDLFDYESHDARE